MMLSEKFNESFHHILEIEKSTNEGRLENKEFVNRIEPKINAIF